MCAALTVPLLRDRSDLPRPAIRDGAGAVLSSTVVLVLIAIAYGIDSWGWWSWPTLASALVLASLVALLIRVESRAADPMLHRALWQQPTRASGPTWPRSPPRSACSASSTSSGCSRSRRPASTRRRSASAAALVPFAAVDLPLRPLLRAPGRPPRPLGTGADRTRDRRARVRVALDDHRPGRPRRSSSLPLALCGVGAGIANGGLTGVAVLSEGHDRLDEAGGHAEPQPLRRLGPRHRDRHVDLPVGGRDAAPARQRRRRAPADEVAIGGSAFHDAVAQLRQDLRAPFEAAPRARTAEAFATTMRTAAVVMLVLTLLSVWLLRPSRRLTPVRGRGPWRRSGRGARRCRGRGRSPGGCR